MTRLRIGHGYDVHRFGPGEHIVLCGLRIPHSAGLIAHSDGDVAIHALCDALLGALALGDIGQHFPDSDPAWRGVDSGDLLHHCQRLIAQRGYQIGNLDITIAAQAPRLAGHIPAMRASLAALLGLALDQISVKATTTEKLGFVGREEGIAVDAVVLLDALDAA